MVEVILGSYRATRSATNVACYGFAVSRPYWYPSSYHSKTGKAGDKLPMALISTDD